MIVSSGFKLPDYGRIDPDLLSFLDEHFGSWQRSKEVALSAPLQERRGISRQAATALLNRLVSSRILTLGKGLRPKTYNLAEEFVFSKKYPLDGLEEHVVWHEDLEPILTKYASPAAMKIWAYGTTEMINNAIDHSEGQFVWVSLRMSPVHATCRIHDDGEGIFRRIKRLCKLADERQAILELSKGKLTTDPKRHSGEGLFFTSRAMDWFDLDSYGLAFNHVDAEDAPDFLLENDYEEKGTTVTMDLNHRTKHNLTELFNQFAEPDSFSFNKTIVPVRLAKIGAESLVSRSQAARLLARVDKFEHVIFDFTGVDSIGQAFADEIFRVFRAEHPNVKLGVESANEDVHNMIRRATAPR
ncbi:STAS-like domain-containing protein [Bordetella bronchiseptica]|uniref:STAS-like domain-containing protein n=1 Tax=Bordetella bronchiseptica TaxID=518 RepID=UPI0004595240|nr:DUF4325 domain-containing protein [Bordetella bronchiseptica]KAK52550.1 PF14213 domain protein [Bordetella bronchiseptica OSU054]